MSIYISSGHLQYLKRCYRSLYSKICCSITNVSFFYFWTTSLFYFSWTSSIFASETFYSFSFYYCNPIPFYSFFSIISYTLPWLTYYLISYYGDYDFNPIFIPYFYTAIYIVVGSIFYSMASFSRSCNDFKWLLIILMQFIPSLLPSGRSEPLFIISFKMKTAIGNLSLLSTHYSTIMQN